MGVTAAEGSDDAGACKELGKGGGLEGSGDGGDGLYDAIGELR
jgi:hypothetical protein